MESPTDPPELSEALLGKGAVELRTRAWERRNGRRELGLHGWGWWLAIVIAALGVLAVSLGWL